jgi:hypothetical protein
MIQIHFITDGPCKGWVHTHGLADHGQPELEIRRVPGLFVREACRILNSVAEYMLTRRDKPVLPGHTVELGRDSVLLMLEGKPDHEAGYDESHYHVPVLTITALEPACELCGPRARA